MRIAIVLPGLHRVARGAEVAFEAIACELAKHQDVQVWNKKSSTIQQ